ncbi:MAG: LysR family transcriptional regulator [Pseudomonadota bacterium]
MNEIERLSIDSDLLLTFVHIAECGNLTVAAGKLARTQSAISVQLRKLEDGLGVKLFTRTAKGMVLTPSGQTLLSKAKPILNEIRETAQLFRKPLTGSIRVGLPDDFDNELLEQILIEFSRAHPEVQVLAQSGCTANYKAAIQSDELDIAVCSGIDDPGADVLNSEEIVWATGENFVWNKPENTVPIAVLDRTCHWRDLPVKLLDGIGRPYRMAFQSASFQSLKSALRSGIAIGLLHKSSVGHGFQILAEKDGLPAPPRTFRYIVRSGRAPTDLVAAMESAIRNAPLP